MRKYGACSEPSSQHTILAPAYPFSGRELLADLRVQLAEELQEPMTYDVIGRMIGRPRSTTHRLFTTSLQPHLISYMCLLERLSPERRRAFIDKYCRICPTLDDPRLAHSPAQTSELIKSLDEPAALTIVAGGTVWSRSFIGAALCHAWQLRVKSHASITGIDLHRPADFVPIEGIFYIDGTVGRRRVGEIVAEIMPRILTTDATLLIFDGVWSAAPGWRNEILSCARNKNVILVEAGMPAVTELKGLVRTQINSVTISTSKCVPEGICLMFRCVK